MSIFVFKQKTAYEMRIRDWSSDVCSSDLGSRVDGQAFRHSENDSGLFPPVAQRGGSRERRGRQPGQLSAPLLSAPAACAAQGRRADGDSRGACQGNARLPEIGRTTCRGRVWRYVEIEVVAVAIKKKRYT